MKLTEDLAQLEQSVDALIAKTEQMRRHEHELIEQAAILGYERQRLMAKQHAAIDDLKNLIQHLEDKLSDVVK